MQNKELLSHLQKLMSQLSQIQSFQQSLSAAPPQTTPTTSPPPQTTLTSDSNMTTQEPPASTSGNPASNPTTPLSEDSTLLLPAMTSTPSQSSKLTNEVADDEVPAPNNMSLGIDFDLITSPATNDPFLPQGDGQPSS